MTSIIYDHNGRVLSKTKDLRAIMDRDAEGTGSPTVTEKPLGGATLRMTWPDGSHAVSDFASLDVCLDWVRRRRAKFQKALYKPKEPDTIQSSTNPSRKNTMHGLRTIAKLNQNIANNDAMMKAQRRLTPQQAKDQYRSIQAAADNALDITVANYMAEKAIESSPSFGSGGGGDFGGGGASGSFGD